MRCPDCRKDTVNAVAHGVFSFHLPSPPEIHDALKLFSRRSRGSGYHSAMERELRTILRSDLATGNPVSFTLPLVLCLRCELYQINPDGLPATDSDATVCPRCGSDALRDGIVSARIRLVIDPHAAPALVRGLMNWWVSDRDIEAKAKNCAACGWVGIIPATLVEPASRPGL